MGNHLEVMLSTSEASAFTAACKQADSSAKFILSLAEGPQNDILAQERARSQKDAPASPFSFVVGEHKLMNLCALKP